MEKGSQDSRPTSGLFDTKTVGTMTTRTFYVPENQYDVDRLRIDRDFYQKEYLKLVSRPNNDTVILGFKHFCHKTCSQCYKRLFRKRSTYAIN